MNTIHSLGCTLLLGAVTTAAAAQSSSDLVRSSDPDLGALAARLLPELAERAGMELHEPVRLETRTRAELIRYLQFKLDEELPAEEATNRTDAYAFLGLVPPDLDLRGVLLELYTEQVAGFYEPDSTALFVLDDQPAEALEPLLVHELVHAVQDQTVDLHALTDSDLGADRAIAAQAAIEGHATLVMFEYLTEQMTGRSVDLGLIPDFASQLRPALAAMNGQFPALARAPRVIRDELLFPYLDGAGFVQRLWVGGERHVPFGDELPLSTEQIIWPGAAPPLDVQLGVQGARILLQDVIGALALNIFLEDVIGLPGGEAPYGGSAGAITAAWEGDRYALVARADGSRALVWCTLWSIADARDRFLEAVSSRSDHLGGPVELEAATISGRAASIVRIGGSGYSVSTTVRAGAN